MIEKEKIFVTQPTLPPLNEFVKYLEDIWNSKWITNNGIYHQQFEKKISEFLDVNHCSLCANGTLALMIGLKALRITGEVITTPFSFVATSNAIHWAGGTPVFCDIEEDTCNIDPEKIESLITSKTSAILPVHVYGNPCNVKRIREIAEQHDLKIIYDAAHAFYTKINGESILNFGDISVLSFHATKVFNTIEGGAVISNNEKIKKKMDRLINFGFIDNETVSDIGLNAKMNELQSAYGLLQLQTISNEISKRKKIAEYYREKLKKIKGIKLLKQNKNVETSYPYFPIFIDKNEFGKSRDNLFNLLKKHKIYSRKYFYPLISHLDPYKHLKSAYLLNLPVAKKISEKVLCLPIFGDLSYMDINKITRIIKYKKNK